MKNLRSNAVLVLLAASLMVLLAEGRGLPGVGSLRHLLQGLGGPGPRGGPGQRGPGQQGGGPPQEAIDACVGKVAGDTVTFTTPRGSVTGTCETTPSGQLAARPTDGGQQGPNSGMPHRDGTQGGPGGDMPPRNGTHGGPPQEAIDACVGKAAGDAVTFTTPRGIEVNATCETTPSGQLAARPAGFGPEGPRNGTHGGPPQEAIDACVGKAAGDAVTFTTPRGIVVNATCETTPSGQLVARPAEGPRNGPRGGPPREAIDACVGKVAGDTVTFATPRGSVTGTCETTPSGQLAARPAKDAQPGRRRSM